MTYLSPKPTTNGISFPAVIGMMALAFGLGVGFAKNYTHAAYKLGYDAAQRDLAKGAFLDNTELAKSACAEWWFGTKYRLQKGK